MRKKVHQMEQNKSVRKQGQEAHPPAPIGAEPESGPNKAMLQVADALIDRYREAFRKLAQN
jgi:hypothetical protein